MSRAPSDLPERLLARNATDFERRVIDAALQNKPSAEASARLAKALGVSVIGVGTSVASKALDADGASKATAATGASTVWTWVSLGVVGLVVAGAIGIRSSHMHPFEHAAASPLLVAPPTPQALPTAPAQSPGEIAEPVAVPTKPNHRSHAAATRGDLRDEIAVVDAARAAVASGDGGRALEILRRYEIRYASGSFRPEAAATKIEALMKLGRETEARSLASRFVAEHRGSLVAARVAALVGLNVPAAGH